MHGHVGRRDVWTMAMTPPIDQGSWIDEISPQNSESLVPSALGEHRTRSNFVV